MRKTLLLCSLLLTSALLAMPGAGFQDTRVNIFSYATSLAGVGCQPTQRALWIIRSGGSAGVYRCSAANTFTAVGNSGTVTGTGTTGRLAQWSSSTGVEASNVTLAGPTAARTVTLPDANISVARTDAGQTFTGANVFSNAGGSGLRVVDGATVVLEANRGGNGRVEGQFYDRNGSDQFVIRTIDATFANVFKLQWMSGGSWFTGAADVAITRAAANILGLTDASTGGGALEFTEMTMPAAPAANKARLFTRDNGAGKTQLVVRFASGAEQVIAAEP